MTELADLTVSELLEVYRTGQASPTDALKSCLGRIERLDPDVNAMLTLLFDRALTQAADSTKRWLNREARDLEGVPYGLKDMIATKGIRSTGGSRLYDEYIPLESATLANRLEDAGGVLVGKLQTFEFAAGANSGTPNPWNLDRWAAGSSSGSVAAVAAHELPLTFGTDTGGSIIAPSAFCGVVGLKPTYGRVPRSGIMPLSWTLDHAGPIARSVYDTALSLQVIAGHDPGDPTSARAPVDDYLDQIEAGLDGVRIGVPTDWFFEILDPEVETATRNAIRVLESHGAKVLDIPLPSTSVVDLHAIEHAILFAELASLHEGTFARLEEYGPEFQRLLVASQFTSASDYLKALRARHLVQLDFQKAFAVVDALVTPAQVCTAPLRDRIVAKIGNEERPMMEIGSRPTAIMDIVGIPTITFPVGFDQLGLPIGLQVGARPYNEAMCFRIGHAYQQLADFHKTLPAIVEADARDNHDEWRAEMHPSVVQKPVFTATEQKVW